MTINFLKIVTTEFTAICHEFNLSIKSIHEHEVAILGNGFVLLVWISRDGVSVKYVEIHDQPDLQEIDLGDYLVSKRTWIVADSVTTTEDFESDIKQGLSSYTRTLREVAPDILEGQKDWLSETSHLTMALSKSHADEIRMIVS